MNILNEEQIKNMPADKEIDALIAEKIMGQTDFSHVGFYWSEGTTSDGKDGWDGFQCPRCNAEKGNTEKCVEHYSTNIYDAWKVAEKVAGLYQFYICSNFSSLPDKKWLVTFQPQSDDDSYDELTAYGDTALLRFAVLHY